MKYLKLFETREKIDWFKELELLINFLKEHIDNTGLNSEDFKNVSLFVSDEIGFQVRPTETIHFLGNYNNKSINFIIPLDLMRFPAVIDNIASYNEYLKIKNNFNHLKSSGGNIKLYYNCDIRFNIFISSEFDRRHSKYKKSDLESKIEKMSDDLLAIESWCEENGIHFKYNSQYFGKTAMFYLFFSRELNPNIIEYNFKL